MSDMANTLCTLVRCTVILTFSPDVAKTPRRLILVWRDNVHLPFNSTSLWWANGFHRNRHCVWIPGLSHQLRSSKQCSFYWFPLPQLVRPALFSHLFFFDFPLWNVTFRDLDRPSWGFCTLGGISIGPWGLFIRDTPFLCWMIAN